MVAELLPTSNWEGAVGSGPIKKTQGKMRSHDLGRKDSQRKMKEKGKGKGERKLTRASRNGGCRYGRNKHCRYGKNR